jgi:hypothetical protein
MRRECTTAPRRLGDISVGGPPLNTGLALAGSHLTVDQQRPSRQPDNRSPSHGPDGDVELDRPPAGVEGGAQMLGWKPAAGGRRRRRPDPCRACSGHRVDWPDWVQIGTLIAPSFAGPPIKHIPPAATSSFVV